MKLKKISLTEREELEPLIIKDPEVIEEGLKIMTHQLMTNSGPLDILAIDSDGCLVIMELKVQAVDEHIDQGLRYFDWCFQNISWIAQAYKQFSINTDLPPRLILVSPSFTENVKRIAKYINVDLQLIEYVALENDNKEKTIVCTQINFGQPPEPAEIPTLDKKLDYFRDKNVRLLFEKVIDELKSKDIEIKLNAGLWISLKYKNKVFMYMSPKRNFFAVEVLTTGNTWTQRFRVNNDFEWNDIKEKYIAPYLNYVDSQ
jgi:hypothetical protein